MPHPSPPETGGSSGKKQKDLLWQRRVFHDDKSLKEMKRFYRMLDSLLRVKKNYPQHTDRQGLGAAVSRQQLCIAKLRFGKTMEGHMKFLKLYLPQENKKDVLEKPPLFGDKGQDDPAAAYERHMAGKHFKFIISPENQRVNIEALVRTLVKRMEAATGRKFHWLAATHDDTAHRHAHLLINGADRDGRDFSFSKAFVTQTVREMARQICTAMIGPRTGEEIKLSLSRAHTAMRYTPIDEGIRNIERPYEGADPRFGSQADAAADTHYRRLCFLETLGFAAHDEKNRQRFYLEKGWKSKLKTQGRYNSFLDARKSLLFTSPHTLEQFTGDTGFIEGKITRLYKMNDEDSWNHAMVVENKAAGKSWYVPLYFEPRDKLLGAAIRCSAESNQRGQLRPKITILDGKRGRPIS
jgi:hypothetical protein